MENKSKKSYINCNYQLKNIVTLPRDKIKLPNKTKRKIDWKEESKLKTNSYDENHSPKCLRTWDYISTLPKSLEKRVANIIELPSEDKYFFDPNIMNMEVEDRFLQEEASEKNKEKIGSEPEKSFNESTCSLILQMQQKFNELNLKTEETITDMQRMKNANWQSEYICEPRKKRVKWNSKLYKLDEDIDQKPADERAEEIMEAAAERFSNWLNSYGTPETNISKNYIRDLFNIDTGAKLLSGVQICPKIIKAVPHNIAETWNMPQLSITNKFRKKLLERKFKIPKLLIKHAFGRTIPYRNRPWEPIHDDIIIEPNFPKELLTYSVLFKGITHLRSTKELINYLEKNPEIERPKYLVDNGLFTKKETDHDNEKDSIPLYELFEKAEKSYQFLEN